jgi:hypothetical protein
MCTHKHVDERIPTKSQTTKMSEEQLQCLADTCPSVYRAYLDIQIQHTEFDYIRSIGIFHVECVYAINRLLEQFIEVRNKLKLVPFSAEGIRMGMTTSHVH